MSILSTLKRAFIVSALLFLGFGTAAAAQSLQFETDYVHLDVVTGQPETVYIEVINTGQYQVAIQHIKTNPRYTKMVYYPQLLFPGHYDELEFTFTAHSPGFHSSLIRVYDSSGGQRIIQIDAQAQ